MGATTESYGTEGLVLESSGEVTVDRNGLWAGSCRFKVPVDRSDLLPVPGDPHPLLSFMLAERTRLVMAPGLWIGVVEYAGANADSIPQYELNPGVGTEPIETNPDFIDFAGTPASPLNGARWINPETNKLTKSMVPGTFEFDKFCSYLGSGAKNPWSGTTGFLEANNTVWQKSWTSKSKPSPGHALVIAQPHGDAPDYGGNYNWLEHPVAYTKRGGAYACTQRWLLSGRRGWNHAIYKE